MKHRKDRVIWGAWVAQSVEHPTSAQVMISQLVSSSPASGSVLTLQSLEPASDSVSPCLSAPPPLTLCVSLSTINKQSKNFFEKFKKNWGSNRVEFLYEIKVKQSVLSLRCYMLTS